MSTNQTSSGSSELHLAVATVDQSMVSSVGDASQSTRHRDLVPRARDEHRVANRRSRSLGPYQASDGASDVSGLEAGRLVPFDLDEEEHRLSRVGRVQDFANPSQGQGQRVLHAQSATFVDARSVDARSIQVGISPEAAQQFADTVRSATIAEAESRHHQVVDEVWRVSSQAARNEAIVEAESRHQHVVQDMARASREHVQDVSARVASDVRSQTLAEAETIHQRVLAETIQNAERVHAQSVEDARNQVQRRDESVILELQNQVAHLTRLNQELVGRLQAAESSGSFRALPASGGQVGANPGLGPAVQKPPTHQHDESFDLFGDDEPANAQSESHGSINQVLAVLQEEVQTLREEMSKSKKGKSKRKSTPSSVSASSSSSSDHDPEYENERKLMRLKAYEKIKVPNLPKSAAEMRTWKNTLISQLVACCRSSEKELLAWLSGPLVGEEKESDVFPVLNRVLGSKLLEVAKGGRFGVDFQALQERSVRLGKQVQGHLLLGRICRKFRLDKERGMSLSQQHLLALKPQGVEIKDLEVFRDRVEFVLSSLETSEYPSEAILRTWIYECLKNVPKLALKIDRYKEANAGDPIRSFQWLWQSMIDCIDESQHDHNTASILNALRSKVDAAAASAEQDKKKDKKVKKEKSDSSKEKTSVDVAAASSSKAPPKAKANPKPKSSSSSQASGKKGDKDKKDVVAGEKGTPCLFYPSGTCRRDPCPFVHDPAAKAKSKAKPKASSSVAAAFAVAAGNLPSAASAVVPRIVKAVVTSFALMCNPGIPTPDNQVQSLPMQSCEVPFTSFNASTGEVTWLGDTGAGRNIGGVSQVDPEMIGQSNLPVTFSTGGGRRDGSNSCRVVGELSGSNECYLLENSPWALSIGDQVRQGKAFVWLPRDSHDVSEDAELPKPFLVKPSNLKDLKVSCPEASRFYASEVRENVPLFKERVSILHMPGEVDEKNDLGDSSKALEEESDGYEPSLAPEGAAAPPDEEAVEHSSNHSILHLPKRADCPICQEAKQDAVPARRVKGDRVLTDSKPSKSFGDRIHADHIIVAKHRLDGSKKGLKGETKCLVLLDDFTKIVMAYPAATKSTEECVKALKHFGGKRPLVEFHADNTPEYESTASQLGLVYDATVPYRKTAIINRAIRTLEDVTRCCLVQVGNFNELWPLAIRYAASASTISNWDKLHDHEFPGLHIPFGALISYKPNAPKSKLGAKTSAGLFLGWRIEAGIQWKRTYLVCDVQNVKSWLEGKSGLQVLTTMVVVQTGEDKFPLREAVQKKLESLEDLPVLRLEDDVRALEEEVSREEVEPELDDIFADDPLDEPKVHSKHEAITFSRLMQYGFSPGCSACEKGKGIHTSSCRERFDGLIRGGKFTLPKGIAKGVDSWKLEGDLLTRFHHVKRKKLFNPLLPEDLPVSAKRLGARTTEVKYFESGVEETIHDEHWRGNNKSLKEFWTGQTIFQLHPEASDVPAGAVEAKDGELQASPRPIQCGKKGKRLAQKLLPAYGVMIEFCCSPQSNLGKVSESVGVKHIRLTESNGKVSELEVQSQLLEVLDSDAMNGVDLWGSLPCNPWSRWQHVNCKKLGPAFRRKLMLKRLESKKLLKFFFQLSAIILRRGGRVHFEWPTGCSGWQIPELQDFFNSNNFQLAHFNGCMVGGESFKPWTVASTDDCLVRSLRTKTCDHSHKHVHLCGSKTPKSAFYPMQMCEGIISSLFPELYHKFVPCMSCESITENPVHVPKEVELEGIPISIHELIDRKVWKDDPAALSEAKKEAQGLIDAGTWDYKNVVQRHELEHRSRKSGTKIAIGKLMTIMSWKNAESEKDKKLKARIVFLGNNVRDEFGLASEFQEIKIIPTTIAGLNINLAFGLKRGNKTTQSDVTKAYIQSDLQTEHDTYIELPDELIPDHLKWMRRPCTKLHKSLYGHPESGGHWGLKFKSLMTQMNGVESALFPSNFIIKKWGLLVTLYVDDIVVSGPSENHQFFWSELEKHLQFEPPQEVTKVLGRTHLIQEGEVQLDMHDFAEVACKVYEQECKEFKGFKKAPTPYLDESTLPIDDWDSQGSLASSAARLIMKAYWLARLSRPDLLHALNELSKRITKWSRNDDRRLFRVFCYLNGTKHYRMRLKLDPDAEWGLWLFTDADHASKVDHGYSTSGSLLAIAGGGSFFPITFQSKRQTACSRSTTEAEAIALASALFSDAIPAQEFMSQLLDSPIPLTCHQDNTATIQVIRNGYSARLRHLGKTHKINVQGLYDAFKEPDISIQHCPAEQQAADVFTKSLEVHKWQSALDMIGIFDPSKS